MQRSMLQVHAPAAGALPMRPRLPPAAVLLQRPNNPPAAVIMMRRSVAVRFKGSGEDLQQQEQVEGARQAQEARIAREDAEQEEQQQPGTPHAHGSPVQRSVHATRAAIDSLLGRHRDNTGRHATTTSSGLAPAAPPPPAAAYEAPLSVPVFSRRREVMVGRVAMAGFYASMSWEVLTRLGPLHQLSVTTGLPQVAVQALLAALVVHGLFGFALLSPTWSAANRNDLLRRPTGFPRTLPANPLRNPARFFAWSDRGWGFDRANELFSGRLAMLGWTGVVLLEPVTGGRGALGQVAWWLHLPAGPAYYELCRIGLVVLPIAFGVLAYALKRPGQLGGKSGGTDVY